MGQQGKSLTRAEAAKLAGVSVAELAEREHSRKAGRNDAFRTQMGNSFSNASHAAKPRGATPENPSGTPFSQESQETLRTGMAENVKGSPGMASTGAAGPERKADLNTKDGVCAAYEGGQAIPNGLSKAVMNCL